MHAVNFAKHNPIKISLIAIIIVAAGLGFIYLKGMSAEQEASVLANAEAHPVTANVVSFPEGDPRLSLIKTQLIPLTPIPVADELSARVTYDDDVTTRITTSFSGRIVELRASPGDKVKVGQVLAIIDSPDVGMALADLNKAKTDEKRKLLAVKRARELVPGEAISKRDWEGVQAEYEQARAEAARAEQRLKNLNPHNLTIDGQRVILASPIEGTVTERSATPAMEVGPALTAPLFVVTDFTKLWLNIDLPESMLGKVKVGSEVSITSEAYPNQKFSAVIVRLGQVINPNSRRANALAVINNAEGKLLPEMFVRASILQDKGEAVRVPNQALTVRGINTYVFVEKSPGSFHLQEIKLLKRGGDFSFVGQGLTGHERVVTRGALLLDAELNSQAGEKQ